MYLHAGYEKSAYKNKKEQTMCIDCSYTAPFEKVKVCSLFILYAVLFKKSISFANYSECICTSVISIMSARYLFC